MSGYVRELTHVRAEAIMDRRKNLANLPMFSIPPIVLAPTILIMLFGPSSKPEHALHYRTLIVNGCYSAVNHQSEVKMLFNICFSSLTPIFVYQKAFS
jgi:hypothetical protein